MLEYRTLDPLRVRIETHRRYSRRPDNPAETVLAALSYEPGAALLAAVVDTVAARAAALFATAREVVDPKGYVVVSASR
ncbi:hypothetical protein GCM10010399_84240 [Dactylosporangium fulvum]|uniref:Uncharacterized protein n=1 Tax=Dactylosporangium fulvum TaxID=53359 RepID=A0ABY5VNZ8_9ACTN|nr:hypothetical protein [Dactylosporangium fulvum]UWP79403.1 hypothetical protein Dfulv_30070 [Dactylosporangium fulvum]